MRRSRHRPGRQATLGWCSPICSTWCCPAPAPAATRPAPRCVRTAGCCSAAGHSGWSAPSHVRPACRRWPPYDGAVRRLLVGHKERGQTRLARPLGAALAGAVQVLGVRGPVVLCPAPSARSAVRARGHDHALQLARAAARTLTAGGCPATALALLVPRRIVADQSGLDAAARAANLAAALRVRRLVGRPVVVVDDVVTTGATLVEATRALTAAGMSVRGAAVVAATARRHRSPVPM